MTISEYSLDQLAESVIQMHSLGYRFTCNFAYGLDWEDAAILTRLEHQLQVLVDFYVRHPDVEPCRLLNPDMASLLTPGRQERWCGAGMGFRVYDTEGKAYPCQQFAPVTCGDELAKQALSIDFCDPTGLIDPHCSDCRIYNICPTCYGSNFNLTGTLWKRDRGLCALTRLATQASAYMWTQRLKQHGAARLGLDESEYARLVYSVEVIAQADL